MGLTAPKEATPVNCTSATDWYLEVRLDNVINITTKINNNLHTDKYWA
jgi:hypothetical protein